MRSQQAVRSDRPDTDSATWWRSTDVVKTLWASQPGTKRLLKQYGPALICVRYRLDASHDHRYTTVELLVDSQRVRHRMNALVNICIDYQDRQARERLIKAGAEWLPKRKMWRVRRSEAVRLGLVDGETC